MRRGFERAVFSPSKETGKGGLEGWVGGEDEVGDREHIRATEREESEEMITLCTVWGILYLGKYTFRVRSPHNFDRRAKRGELSIRG
jgi:hypothetical protein